MFNPDESDFEVFGVEEEPRRWITSSNEKYSFIADDVTRIIIKTIYKHNIKHYYLQCMLITVDSKEVITIGKYNNKHNIILEKRRLLDWLNYVDDSDTFKCFSEYPNVEHIIITAKNFYNNKKIIIEKGEKPNGRTQL